MRSCSSPSFQMLTSRRKPQRASYVRASYTLESPCTKVADATWSLCRGFADLLAYNLVIIQGGDIDHSTVFFFPRPRDPDWEGPAEYAAKGWSFGAFEMGGFN